MALFAATPAPTHGAAPAGRYTVSGGVVHDSKTGLNWQQSTPTATYTWIDARTYCKDNAGKLPGSGWRLPDIKELQTLVDDRSSTEPWIDPGFFPATGDVYWSATPYATNSSYAWVVFFRMQDGSQNWSDVTYQNYVRCVR